MSDRELSMSMFVNKEQYIEALLGEIDQLKQQLSEANKWISVDDALPETKKQNEDERFSTNNILLFLDHGQLITGNYYKHETERDFEFVKCDGGSFDDLKETVTHWQPIPAPPSNDN